MTSGDYKPRELHRDVAYGLIMCGGTPYVRDTFDQGLRNTHPICVGLARDSVRLVCRSSHSGEDGVEDAFGVHLTEHGHHEHDGGDDQPHDGADEGVGGGGGGGRGIPDHVVEDEEISELL